MSIEHPQCDEMVLHRWRRVAALGFCCGAVKLVTAADLWASRGKREAFPGLSIGDRACAVRRAPAQPAVHTFTASFRRHTMPPPPAHDGGNKPRPVFASRVPDAD